MIPPSTPSADVAPEPAGWRRDGPRFALVAWLLATLLLVVATAGAALVVALGAALKAVLDGERASAAIESSTEAALGSPAMTWAAVLASQLALLTSAWLACRVLRKPAGERLALASTGLSPLQGALLCVATVVPCVLGFGAAWLLERVVGPSNADALGLQRMWSEGSRGASVAWVLLIALGPGFAEELFYRGFLLRGLLLRWGPPASILTSGLLFAAVHGELVWATAIFPLGVWLGVVAWRTGSMRLTFVLHALVNGLWTTAMMVLHRDPSSEPLLKGLGLATLVAGTLAFPFALRLLRRPPVRVLDPQPRAFFPRVAGAGLAAAALLFVLVPPGVTPPAPEATASAVSPNRAELEAGAAATLVCTAAGEEGALEFTLAPGAGARVTLPENPSGVTEVLVTLDASETTVWLAYAGERSGKGGRSRPLGIVEQLAAGEPTVLLLTLAPGPPPVAVRLTLEDDEPGKAAAFERATAEGWALRGRK
ncbi:MAG: CPBP family intramembrane glutamic endopeptidase [Planctomycetota bacterium]